MTGADPSSAVSTSGAIQLFPGDPTLRAHNLDQNPVSRDDPVAPVLVADVSVASIGRDNHPIPGAGMGARSELDAFTGLEPGVRFDHAGNRTPSPIYSQI